MTEMLPETTRRPRGRCDTGTGTGTGNGAVEPVPTTTAILTGRWGGVTCPRGCSCPGDGARSSRFDLGPVVICCNGGVELYRPTSQSSIISDIRHGLVVQPRSWAATLASGCRCL